MLATASRTSVWQPGYACWPATILVALRRGHGDPAVRVDRDGTVRWACRTPLGPATLHVRARAGDGSVEATAWGDGGDWLLDRLPRLLGADDRSEDFRPRHPLLQEAVRRFAGWRVPRTGLVFQALLPAILEQKVTGREAWLGWRRLVRRYGDLAPGPDPDLRVPPGPETVRMIRSWEWLRMHVDPARSRAAVAAARVAEALERTAGMAGEDADGRLRSVPGVGVWTAAETRQRAHGDADAVSFGDYHVAADVGWALTGVPLDDAGLAELLEPYRGHRYRVQRLVELTGSRRPRRGPRMAPRTHLPA